MKILQQEGLEEINFDHTKNEDQIDEKEYIRENLMSEEKSERHEALVKFLDDEAKKRALFEQEEEKMTFDEIELNDVEELIDGI